MKLSTNNHLFHLHLEIFRMLSPSFFSLFFHMFPLFHVFFPSFFHCFSHLFHRVSIVFPWVFPNKSPPLPKLPIRSSLTKDGFGLVEVAVLIVAESVPRFAAMPLFKGKSSAETHGFLLILPSNIGGFRF